MQPKSTREALRPTANPLTNVVDALHNTRQDTLNASARLSVTILAGRKGGCFAQMTLEAKHTDINESVCPTKRSRPLRPGET